MQASIQDSIMETVKINLGKNPLLSSDLVSGFFLAG